MISTDDAAIRKGEQCSCELRLVESIDMENYIKFVDNVSELRLKENYGGLLSDKDLFQHQELNGYVQKPNAGSGLKESLFPTWVPLTKDPAHQPVTKDLQCLMTEVQLQAILDSQGDPSEEINLDMMKDQYGKETSKFSLGAMKENRCHHSYEKAFPNLQHEVRRKRLGVPNRVLRPEDPHGLQGQPVQF